MDGKVTVKCEICDTPFDVWPCQAKKNTKYQRKYCSRKCGKIGLSKKIQKLMTGIKNPNWVGGRTIGSRGYVHLTISGLLNKEQILAKKMTTYGTIREHRLKMAIEIGRPLKSTELVHHKNGVRTDNRIENLELLTTDRHCRGGLPTEFTCPGCGYIEKL